MEKEREERVSAAHQLCSRPRGWCWCSPHGCVPLLRHAPENRRCRREAKLAMETRAKWDGSMAGAAEALPPVALLLSDALSAPNCLCRSGSAKRRQLRRSRRSWRRRATHDWRLRPRMPRMRRRRRPPPPAPPPPPRRQSLRRQQLPLPRPRRRRHRRRRCSRRRRRRRPAAGWPHRALLRRRQRPRCPPWLLRWQGRRMAPLLARLCGAPSPRPRPQLRQRQHRRHLPARRRRRRARCRSRRSSTPQTPVSSGQLVGTISAAGSGRPTLRRLPV